jgi:hypothetical protein
MSMNAFILNKEQTITFFNSLNVHECVHFEQRTNNNQKIEMLLLKFVLITWTCTWIWHQIFKTTCGLFETSVNCYGCLTSMF